MMDKEEEDNLEHRQQVPTNPEENKEKNNQGSLLFVIRDKDDATTKQLVNKVLKALQKLNIKPQRIVLIAGGAAVAVISVPVVLQAVGFGAAGIQAGAIAAKVHAMIGNVATGSIFAYCQSIGAAGLGALGKVVAGVVGGVAGAAAGAAAGEVVAGTVTEGNSTYETIGAARKSIIVTIEESELEIENFKAGNNEQDKKGKKSVEEVVGATGTATIKSKL